MPLKFSVFQLVEKKEGSGQLQLKHCAGSISANIMSQKRTLLRRFWKMPLQISVHSSISRLQNLEAIYSTILNIWKHVMKIHNKI